MQAVEANPQITRGLEQDSNLNSPGASVRFWKGMGKINPKFG